MFTDIILREPQAYMWALASLSVDKPDLPEGSHLRQQLTCNLHSCSFKGYF